MGKVKEEVKEQLLQNIVITGGSTNIPDFRQRLYEELKENILGANILNPDGNNREFDAFRGASVLSSSLKEEAWISKNDFDDYGLSIIHKNVANMFPGRTIQ